MGGLRVQVEPCTNAGTSAVIILSLVAVRVVRYQRVIRSVERRAAILEASVKEIPIVSVEAAFNGCATLRFWSSEMPGGPSSS